MHCKTSKSPFVVCCGLCFLIILAAVNLPCKAMIYLIDMAKPLNINELAPPIGTTVYSGAMQCATVRHPSSSILINRKKKICQLEYIIWVRSAVKQGAPFISSPYRSPLSHKVLHLEASDAAVEVACLLEGEAEGGHVVV